jgi:hypothetical protein
MYSGVYAKEFVGAGGAKEFADQPVAIDRVHRKAVQIDNAVDRDCNHEGDPTYA